MWATLVSLGLQLALKLCPLLYQLKIIKTEAELKEFQRRIADAINRAEEGALDSAKLRKQHDDNMNDLDEKWKERWGNKPPNQ
jgi:F0F1-type ATP synthase membrane subunit b/b'